MKPSQWQLLTRLLAQPTAPFRETHVAALVGQELSRHGVPFFHDPHDNIVVGCASAGDYRRRLRESTAEPLRLFIAHMDHPGFHGVRWLSDTQLLVRWLGGSPTRALSGSRVWLADNGGYLGTATLARPRIRRDGRGLDRAELRLPYPLADAPAARDLFGGFSFRAPVWRQGRRVYTQAADDLVGVFAITSMALELFARRHRTVPPFIGLLTRGEEVGFVGAVAHLELGWLNRARRPLIAVSLETSRTLPGAQIGKGPVVRLGDRRTVFEPGALQVLGEIAGTLLPKMHQRRIMDGGTCEATATTAFGIPSVGLSVPLGNYHNEAFEGAPGHKADRGPAPEFVHLDDLDGLLELCRALARPDGRWADPWRPTRRRMARHRRRYQRLLIG